MVVGFSLSLPLYVVRRGDMLYFRMRVPEDIQGFLRTTEISRALRTNNPREAGRRAQRLAWITADLFDDIREGKYRNMDHKEIKRLVADWLREILEEDELKRISRDRPRGLHEIDDEAETLAILETDERERLATDDHLSKTGIAQALLEERGIVMDKEDMAFKTLCRELLKASVSYLEIAQERNIGDYRGTERYISVGEANEKYIVVNSDTAGRKQNQEEGPLLSVVLDAWVKDKLQMKEWTERTRLDNEPMVKDFIEMVGDMPIGRLGPEHLRDARDRFLRVPKNRQKTPKYASFTLRRLSEMDIPEKERLSKQTLHNRAVKIGGFLHWARDRGYPVKEGMDTVMKFKLERRKQSAARAVFSPEDLAKMFNPGSYLKETKGQAARFWVPLIALCTGMRIEEICQLYLGDVREVKGVLCFDVNDRADKGLKTLSSERLVPVSPVLKEIGLSEYLEEVRRTGAPRLFPELEKDGVSKKYSDRISKWFNRYLDRIGIEDDEKEGKKVFHSFRHTFANTCKQKGLDTRKVKQIIGHEAGRDMTLDHYGKAYEPDVLYRDVMAHIVPEVNLRGLVGKWK